MINLALFISKPVSHLISITTPEAHFIAIMVQMKTIAQKNETIPLGAQPKEKRMSSSKNLGHEVE